VEQSAAVRGDVLVVAIATAEKGAELVAPSTEPLRGPNCLEPTHTSCAPFHAAVVLFQPVVFVGTILDGKLVKIAEEKVVELRGVKPDQ
jgi:hypothetical protein